MGKLTLIILLSLSLNQPYAKVANNYHNRYFFYNKLFAVYGKSSKSILEKYFSINATIFGGPCDPYEFTPSDSSSKIKDCNSGIHEMRSNINSSNSNLKNYYFHQICNELSQLKSIKKSDWKTLYKSFYPLEKTPEAKVFGEKIEIHEVSYTLCMSERWKKY